MTKDLILPDPEAYTREQLAERWECDLSLIESYIKSGKLKQGFDTRIEYTGLRKLNYYKCEAGDEGLLNAIKDRKALSEFVNPVIQEKIIPCPNHLYIPFMRNSLMYLVEKSLMLELTHRICMMPRIMVRYFYDLDGNALIPISKKGVVVFWKVKPRFELLSVPLEAIEQFENGCRIVERDENIPSVTHKEKKATEREIPGIQKTIDNAAEDKQPPAHERILRMSEVTKRTGISKSQVHILMNDGRFPKSFPLVPGGRAVGWYESVIDEWIKERNEKKHKDEKADE